MKKSQASSVRKSDEDKTAKDWEEKQKLCWNGVRKAIKYVRKKSQQILLKKNGMNWC